MLPNSDRPDRFSEAQFEEYWRLVHDTLRHVFRVSAGAAKTLADGLRRSISQKGLVQQEFFYHTDPLQVAADLIGAGDRPLTRDEKLRNLALRNPNPKDRPDENTVDLTVPDDQRSMWN